MLYNTPESGNTEEQILAMKCSIRNHFLTFSHLLVLQTIGESRAKSNRDELS